MVHRCRRLILPSLLAVAGGLVLCACASLLGIDDPLPANALGADSSAVDSARPEDRDATMPDGRADDAALDAGIPTEITVVDPHGLPVPGVKVRVRPAGVFTDVDKTGDRTTSMAGSVSMVAPEKYDAYVQYGSPVVKVVAYLELTRRNAILQVPDADPRLERKTSVAGAFLGSIAGKYVTCALATASGSVSWFGLTTPPDAGGTYSYSNAPFFGTTAMPQGTVHCIQSDDTLGNGPYVYGTTDSLVLVPGSTAYVPIRAPIAPAVESIAVSVTAPMGVTYQGFRKQAVLAPEVGMDIGYVPFAGNTTTAAPKINGASFNIVARVDNVPASGDTSFVWAAGIGVGFGSSLAVLKVPASAPVLTKPVPGPFNLDTLLEIATPVGGLREYRVDCSGAGELSITMYSSADGVQVPRALLSTLGVDFSSGMACSWWVSSITAFGSTDAAVATRLGAGSFAGPPTNESLPTISGAIVKSKRSSFTVVK